MLLYYITDRKQFPGTEAEQRRSVLRRVGEAAAAGIDYIQLREKDLPGREVERLALDAVKAVRNASTKTKLLINSRTDIALAVAADGVHLTSTDISSSDARVVLASNGGSSRTSTLPNSWVIAVSCHAIADVRLAESHGADFAVLAPIFEKASTNLAPLGLDQLRLATRGKRVPDTRVEAGDQRATIPVIALGGITVANATQCLRVGAAGIAGIRIFQAGDLGETVKALRRSA